MASEFERLQGLYAELGDEHLMDLGTDMGDLTDEAQLALVGEMRKRGMSPSAPDVSAPEKGAPAKGVPEAQPSQEHSYGFGVGIPGVVPGGEPAMEHALDPGGSTRLGMTALTSFSDGLELSRACDVLAAADIEPAIEEIAGDEARGISPRYDVWVSSADFERSREVLQRKMGLFPPAEADGRGDLLNEDDAGDRVIAQFDSRSEAESVATVLRQADFQPTIDGEGETFSVLVPASEYERALNLLTARMQLD
jgi:hypothetical protein